MYLNICTPRHFLKIAWNERKSIKSMTQTFINLKVEVSDVKQEIAGKGLSNIHSQQLLKKQLCKVHSMPALDICDKLRL